MKDSEKALLALAAVGGYLYWAKKEKNSVLSKPGTERTGAQPLPGVPAAYQQKANVPNQRPLKELTRKQGGKMIESWPKKRQQHFMSLSLDGRKAYLTNLGYAEGNS